MKPASWRKAILCPALLFVLLSLSGLAADLSLISPPSGQTLHSAPFDLSWSLTLSENETLSNFTLNVSTNVSSSAFSTVTHDTAYTLAESDIGLSGLAEGQSALVSWSVTADILPVNQSNSSPHKLHSSSSFIFENPSFRVYLDSDNVSVNSTLIIHLSAPSGTNAELNIVSPSTTDTYFTGADEDTALIYIPTEEGDYAISVLFSFNDYSVTRTASFHAFSHSSSHSDNSTNESSSSGQSSVHLLASLTPSERQVQKQTTVYFKAELSMLYDNNTPVNETLLSSCDFSYAWKVGTNSPVVSSDDSFSYTFVQTGTFDVSLTVTASCSNPALSGTFSAQDSVSITVVKRSFDVAVRVVESFTQRPVPEAVLLVESPSSDEPFKTVLKTNSHGTATLHLKEGEYHLNISKDGYESTVGTLTVSKPDVFTFTLFKKVKKSVLPTVKIVNAPSSISSPNPSITISYSATSDTAITECTLFYQLESFRGWRIGGKQTAVTAGTTYSFTLSSLQSGTYRYRIKCVDSDRDAGFSQTRTFSVVNEKEEKLTELGAPSQNAPDSSSIELLLKRFDDAIISLSSLSGTRREIVDSLALLQAAKQKKQQAKALYDSYKNYKKMGLSDDLLLQKMEETRRQIQSLLDSVVFNVVEVQEHEFISVANPDYMRSTAEQFLKLNSISLSEKDLEKYLSAVSDLNENLDIYTRATLLEIRFGSGKSEYVTLLDENLPLPEDLGSSEDVVLALQIPSDIIRSDASLFYSDIISLNPFRLLKSSSEETFLSLSLKRVDDDGRYPYGASVIIPSGDALDPEGLEKIRALLVFQNIDLSSKKSFGNTITGFAVLGSSPVKLRLVASEILIILVALSLSLFIYSKYISPSKPLSIEEFSEKLSALFENSEELMKKGDVSASALKTFEKALSLYKEAPPIVQSMFLDRFRNLWDYVNLHSAKERIKQAYSFLAQGQLHKAKVSLVDARSLVESLPYEYRKTLVAHLNDAELMLSSGSADSTVNVENSQRRYAP